MFRKPRNPSFDSPPSARPSLTLQQDPYSLTGASAARGEALGHRNPTRLERGTIVFTDASRHAYRVALQGGAVVVCSRIRQHPGDQALLPHGTQVVVDRSLGLPYILGVLPLESAAPATTGAGVTDTQGHGGQDPTLQRNLGATARSGNEPADLIPGDAALTSPDGASTGVLHGRTAYMRGSSLAKIEAFGSADQINITAGQLRTITSMGESSYVNEGGRTSFRWRGGSDQLTETGHDAERYTLRLDAGAAGNVFRLEATTPEGQPVFRLHVDPEGRGELFFAGGLTQDVGRERGQTHPLRYHGNLSVQIEGDELTRISGQVSETLEAGRRTEVSDDDVHFVGRDHVLHANRNCRLDVGDVYGVRAASSTHTVASGNALLKSVTGAVQLQAVGIELGENAVQHATKYEPLAAAWTAFLADYNSFKAAVTAATGVPSVPFTGDLSAAQSAIVKLL